MLRRFLLTLMTIMTKHGQQPCYFFPAFEFRPRGRFFRRFLLDLQVSICCIQYIVEFCTMCSRYQQLLTAVGLQSQLCEWGISTFSENIMFLKIPPQLTCCLFLLFSRLTAAGFFFQCVFTLLVIHGSTFTGFDRGTFTNYWRRRLSSTLQKSIVT